MTDPPGLQPALGIEIVEWFASGAERLTVRVTGRWLRRPPASHGPVMLVVAADNGRHRFQAMPEPPSVSGAPPGAWRVSFSVPAWLAPYLSRRLSLQMGGVIVPLPGARSGSAEELDDDETSLAEPPPRSYEAGADAREQEFDHLTATEERVHELEQQVAALRQETAGAGAGDRIAGALRQEIELARSAPAARASPRALEPTDPRGLRGEREMIAALARRPAAGSSATASGAGAQGAADPERDVLKSALEEARAELARRAEAEAELASMAAALRGELQSRAAAEAELRAELATVRGRLEARTANQTAIEATLDELRRELSELRSADDGHAAARAQAESRASELAAEVTELQSELADTRAQLAELVGARDEAQAEAAALRAEISTLQGELSAARDVSGLEGAALAEAESLLAEAYQLAADAERRLDDEHLRAQEAIAARERIEREFADYRQRSTRVHGAIEDLRFQLLALRESHAAGVQPPQPAAATAKTSAPGLPTATSFPRAEPPVGREVQPERLAEALTRLRESTPAEEQPAPAEQPAAPAEEQAAPAEGTPAESPPEPPPTPSEEARPSPTATKPRRSWLRPVLRTLTAEDPLTAGRLIVELLPAQRLVAPKSFTYDLVLGDRECVQVTVTDAVKVTRTASPRDLAEVDFRVTGDVGSLARLVTARPLRRLFGRHLPQLRGDRRAGAASLRALGRATLGLHELYDAGVRPEAWLSLRLAALMVRPAWTAEERFTIAHELGAGKGGATYLHVREGSPPAVTTERPLGPVATTVICPADALLLLLAGVRSAEVVVRGDERPLAQLQQWVQRAQSG